MVREDALTAAFVRLADTLVDDYDPVLFLQELVDICADLLPCDAVGVLLAGRGRDRLALVAASTDDMRALEVFQQQNEQGPCNDAMRLGKQIEEHDPDHGADRWPAFWPKAAAIGFVSMYAFPMRLRGASIGALNLFSESPRAMSDTQRNTAQALADIATIGISQERAIHDAETLSTQLEHALTARILIEQAKGILMRSQHVSAEDAFERLRRLAREDNKRVRDVAQGVIDAALPDPVSRA